MRRLGRINNIHASPQITQYLIVPSYPIGLFSGQDVGSQVH